MSKIKNMIKRFDEGFNPRVLVKIKNGFTEYNTSTYIDLSDVVFADGKDYSIYQNYLNAQQGEVFHTRSSTGYNDGYERADYDDLEYVRIEERRYDPVTKKTF